MNFFLSKYLHQNRKTYIFSKFIGITTLKENKIRKIKRKGKSKDMYFLVEYKNTQKQFFKNLRAILKIYIIK